jgi:hypothetical protein
VEAGLGSEARASRTCGLALDLHFERDGRVEIARAVGLVVPVASVLEVMVLEIRARTPARVTGFICAPKFQVDGVTGAAPVDGR